MGRLTHNTWKEIPSINTLEQIPVSVETGSEDSIQIYPSLEKLCIELRPKDYKNES